MASISTGKRSHAIERWNKLVRMLKSTVTGYVAGKFNFNAREVQNLRGRERYYIALMLDLINAKNAPQVAKAFRNAGEDCERFTLMADTEALAMARKELPIIEEQLKAVTQQLSRY